MRRIGFHNLRYRKNQGTSCLIIVLIFVALALVFTLYKLNYAAPKLEAITPAETPNPAMEPVVKKPVPPVETIAQPVEDPKAERKPRYIAKGDYLLVQKDKHLLQHYRDGLLLASYPVALGLNPEDKAKTGDNATPEGHYEVNYIKDSSSWTHDFKDGKGEIKGAYGPFFIALYTGARGSFSGNTWRGIGIHGTHDPSSIGTNASEGCIRLHNSDLLKLKDSIEGKQRVQIDIIK